MQLVDMSYLIFQKSGIFMDSLLRWNKKSSAPHTFTNFKAFMRDEYLALQEVGGLSVNNSILNQANINRKLLNCFLLNSHGNVEPLTVASSDISPL